MKNTLKWKYVIIAVLLNAIIIFSTNGTLELFNAPKWLITTLRIISYSLILPYFAAYWAIRNSEDE